MCSRLRWVPPRAWLHRAALLALAALLAGAAGPDAAAAEPVPAAVFVRGGVVLPAGLSARAAATVRLDGRSVPAERLPAAAGWLVPVAWKPRASLHLAWSQDGRRSERTVRAPLKPEPLVLHALDWPPAGTLDTGADVTTALAFSPDGDYLAAGTQHGRVAVFARVSGARAWSLRREGRVIKALAFSPDGARLYVGEQGPEGRLAAYAWRSGAHAPLWHFDTAAELGGPAPGSGAAPYAWVTWPGAYRIAALGDDLLAACTHSEPGPGGRTARARLYRLDGRTGRLRWAWPTQGPAAMMITWFAEAQGGRRIALPLQLPQGAQPSASGQDASRVVVLDGASGRFLVKQTVPPVPPYRFTAFWRGVGLRPDGRRLAVATEDGRALLYADGARGWRLRTALTLVQPVVLGGVTVTATSGTLVATPRQVVFATGPSYVPLAYGQSGEPARRHPNGNTLFGYGWDGAPRWLWRLDSDLQGLALSADGRTLALAEGREGPQRADGFNGLAVLDVSRPGDGRAKLRYRFPLAGRAVYDGVAVSPDGRWIALAEAPRTLRDDPRPRGRRRLLLLH